MRLDTAVGLSFVRGAACAHRIRWPRGITDGGDGTAVAHLGVQPTDGFTVTAYAGGTQQTLIKAGTGTPAVDMKSTAAAGNGFGILTARRWSPFLERTGGPVVDEWTCYEIRATIAFDNPAGATALDHGIFVLCGNQNTMTAGGFAGVQLGVTDAQQVSLRSIIANGGAAVVTDVVAAGLTPDVTKFNSYAIRMIGGSGASDPVFYGLINNVIVTPRHAMTAAAGLFPPANIVPGSLGFTVAVINISAANVPNMYVHDVCVSMGQTEADLT